MAAWPPPADESSRLLRPAPPGYILTWAGAEYAFGHSLGLQYLLLLMDRSPEWVHAANIVDPSGQAYANLGATWESEIDGRAAAEVKRAVHQLPDGPEQKKLKSYLRGGGRHAVAGGEAFRVGVYDNLHRALVIIKKASPAAHAHIESRLTIRTHSQYRQ